MPNKCSVPECRGNYDSENKVHVFSIPKTPTIRSLWIQAIPRKNFQPTKNARVCEKHFAPGEIEYQSTAYDERSGKLISAALKNPRLKKGVIPSIFPGCPEYLSRKCSIIRESPAERRTRVDNENIARAIKENLEFQASYDKSKLFTNFEELLSCVEQHECSEFWTKIVKKDCLLYININTEQNITVNYVLSIDPKLNVNVTLRGECINKSLKIPPKIKSVNEIDELLQNIENLTIKNEERVNHLISLIKINLNLLKIELEYKSKILDFIFEQISLLNTSPEHFRYSPYLLIFASMIHLISSKAYRFIRNSEIIILPHETTIKKLNSKITFNPIDEQMDPNFLAYASQKKSDLKDKELYVSLMMDGIHLKEFVDFKAGNIVGMSHDNAGIANSAYVFMVSSLFSTFKEVIHILPVKKIDACILFSVLKKIIIGLENIGYKVIVIVSDNDSVNRKAVALFDNKLADYVYPHPCDASRPLFYCVDSVHLIKCIRNNWVNQKNEEKAMYYPDFESFDKVLTASFVTLRKVYEFESGSLLKYGYTLSQKSLWPSSFEKQSVNLALQIFNINLSKNLSDLNETCDIVNIESTSKYIEVFTKWFTIMNVKSPGKGIHLRDKFCEPLTSQESDENILFLEKFLQLLTEWKNLVSDTGRLTRETHSALVLTTKCMIDLTSYCTNELNMKYLLPGKIQTDDLEFRFGLYRRLAGTQYHISIRQVYEVENKLRACSVLKELTIDSSLKGSFSIQEIFCEDQEETEQGLLIDPCFSKITVTNTDIQDIQQKIPLITYISGYCVHSVVKRTKCTECKNSLTIDEALSNNSAFKVIHNVDRGGLKFPSMDVLNVTVHNFIVIQNILKHLETDFLKVKHQAELISCITLNVLSEKDMSISTCNKHTPLNVMKMLIRACTNTILKNYCKIKNDAVKMEQKKKSEERLAKKRKLETLQK